MSSSLSSCSVFDASVMVSSRLSEMMLSSSVDLAYRCVQECAKRYNFDEEEAIRHLNLGLSVIKNKRVSLSKKVRKVEVKSSFPLPYNGEFKEENCYALRQNNGLYTQCTIVRNGSSNFCKGCARQMEKLGIDVPEYGTIQERMAVDILDYVDPKGRKPVAYTKVMKKYKISKEDVEKEAEKLNISINEKHFVEVVESKRGRPSSKNNDKEVKVKGVKGRPKKERKVLQIEGDEDDLFASLVAQANMDEVKVNKNVDNSEEEAAKKAKEEQRQKEKAEKEEQRQKEKAEKEAKIAAEKAEKEAKKEQERLAREAKKIEEEAAKKAKEEQRQKEKAEKEAKIAAEKLAKEQAKNGEKNVKKVVVDENEEQDVVKKIEYAGKKYLKSKNTGIIYDYDEYVKNNEQVILGKWNNNTNKIDFEDAGEESEEEYD